MSRDAIADWDAFKARLDAGELTRVTVAQAPTPLNPEPPVKRANGNASKRKPQKRREWSAHDIDRLRRLVRQGKDDTEAAYVLDRSLHDVREMMFVQGLLK